MRYLLVGAALLTGLLVGCDDGTYDVLVSLRTDLVPGADFVVARTSLEGVPGGRERSALFGDPYEAGVLIAELDGIPAGEQAMTVSLLSASGGLVAERRVRFNLDRDTGITVLVTRDCRGVTCPERQSCVGGSCVDDSCASASTEAECAPAVECSLAGDCALPPASCAAANCVEGVCFSEVVPGSCAPDEYCDIDVGCMRIPMTAPMDAGRDGATDGATEARVDASMDATPGDTGTGAIDGDAAAGACVVPLASVPNTVFGGGQSIWTDGDLALVGLTGAPTGIQLFDVADPAAPVARGTFLTDDMGPGDLPGEGDVTGIDVVGNLAYLATYTAGVVIVDISNRAAPSFVGAIDLPSESWMIEVAGATAYVANHGGLVVLDVSAPASPTVVTTLPVTGASQDLHLDGALLYTASQSHFNVVDISAPRAPALVDSLVAGTRAYEVWGTGGTAYTADLATGQLFAFSATTSAVTPGAVTARDSPRGFRAIDGEGNRIVVGTDGGTTGTVRLYDRAAGGAPVLLDEANLDSKPYEVRVVGNVIYAITELGSLATFSIAPCTP